MNLYCPLNNLFAKCCCSSAGICSYCAQLTFAVLAVIFGAVVALNPKKIIDLQIALYRLINWNMSPISMEKEIRNTRVIGCVVAVLGVISLFWIII